MKKLLLTLLLLSFITACDTGIRIEKRRYMKGYFVDLNKSNNKLNQKTNDYNTINENATASSQSTEEEMSIVSETENEITIPSAKQSKQSSDKKIKIPLSPSIKQIGENAISKQKQKTAIQKNKKAISYSILAICAILMGLGIKKVYQSKRANVSKLKQWSVKNKRKALLLSVLARALLLILGFGAGVKLFELDYLFPQHTLHFGIGAYALGLIIFLFRKSTYERFFSFMKAKFHSLIMATVGFILFATIGNNAAHENSQGINPDKHINKRSSKFFESKKQDDHKSTFSFANLFKINNEDDAGTTVLKVFLIVLAILSIIVLEALALIFSCALMCEGNEAAGVALLVGGTLFLAALAIITLYWINRIDTAKIAKTS